MATVTTSKQFSLNLNDWWKGLIMAILTPAFAIIMDSINQGSLTFNWKIIAGAALSGLLAYLAKNFFTPPAVVIKNVSNETIDAVKDGAVTAKITKV